MDRDAHLLVVDDTPQNVRLLEAMLTPHGYTLATASSGGEGLEKLHSEHPDLVLLDILMPDMTGYDVCRRLREDPATRLLPVIMLTSSGDQDKVNAIEAGRTISSVAPSIRRSWSARFDRSCASRSITTLSRRRRRSLPNWNRTLEQRVEEQVAQLEGSSRLRRYFSAPVAEVIMSGGDQMLEPHRREVTILFCDLRGFTAFSATAEPEEVMSVLSHFYGTVGRLILRYEATLEQFAGDSVMAIFNDPVPCADHTAAAVRMAVEVRDRMRVLTDAWRLNGFDLDTGIGIAEGYATLGRVGFEGRFDYRATGSVVNLAARLCAEARGGQILLSPRAFATVTGLAEIEPVGPLQLKGFHDPVQAYNVGSLREEIPSESTRQASRE